MNVMNKVSTKKTMEKNVTSTASINCHSIKVRDYCYILHTVLLSFILLLIIIIIWYHYVKKGII